jgi:hypothetical protein
LVPPVKNQKGLLAAGGNQPKQIVITMGRGIQH